MKIFVNHWCKLYDHTDFSQLLAQSNTNAETGAETTALMNAAAVLET